MKLNNKLYHLLMFILFCALFFVLQFASIGGHFFPFAFSMLFALAWANQKVWLICPAYIISSIAKACTFENAINAIVVCVMLALPYYIHVVSKKNMKKWELGIYLLLSQVSWIVFSALGGMHPVIIVANVLVAELFLFASITIFEPIIVRGFAYKLTSLELVCGGVVLMALSNGLSGFTLFGFSFLKLFVAFSLLSISYTSKTAYTTLIAGVLGFGTLVASNNPLYIAPFMLWALSIVAFKSTKRLYPFIAIIVSELVIGFYFKLYFTFGILEIAPLLLGAIIFLFLPRKWYDNLSVLLSSNSDRLAVKSMVNRNREVLHRRLNNLSEVFFEMNQVFKKLIKEEMTPEEVKNLLYEEVRDGICKNCPEYKHCHRTFSAETKKMFCELITISMDRGRITLLDFPSYLTSRCGRVNNIISEVNTLTKQYKNYASLVGNIDNSKLLISDQLGGMAQIMKSLAGEVDSMVSFNSSQENKIIDELAYNNIICTDAVVFDKDARTIMANLVVRSDDANRPKLSQVVSKVCGSKMSAYEIYPSTRAGLVNVNMKTSPRYDAIFGVASQAKSGTTCSGDTHSVIRLDGDRFMFALCDGMGSGEKASEKSETAIGLIENFYKAGFDNDIILSSVNRLLNLEKDDIFSTIDICVVDLKNGIADIIKMGAPSSYIRGEDECKIIEGGALPVGVLQDAKAQTQKVVLSEKDYIVICSDGISDSFGSDGELKDFILTIKTANPQEYADKIIGQALANNNGYAVDDMTVVVVKIFEN